MEDPACRLRCAGPNLLHLIPAVEGVDVDARTRACDLGNWSGNGVLVPLDSCNVGSARNGTLQKACFVALWVSIRGASTQLT